MIWIFIIAIVLFTAFNFYNRKRTFDSVDKEIKKWKNIPKEKYARKCYDFVANRFKVVHHCYIKFPWRNFFYKNMWYLKNRGLPCHIQNIIFQRCLIKKFSNKEIKTTYGIFPRKGIFIHIYSKIKFPRKWKEIDVWGKKRGIPYGKTIKYEKYEG